MLKHSLLLLCFTGSVLILPAQKTELLTSGTKVSIRGLSVVSEQVIWVSGSNGTIGKSLDGGKTWQWSTVKGFEKRDFRDIEAFDDQTAIIIAIAEPANILKTTDGGQSWKVVFTDSAKGMFLDAMDFYDKNHGIVVGDPIDSKFFLARTKNGGNTWEVLPSILLPKAINGEACFAASGTNIHYFRNRDFLFVSGGTQSRLHDDSGGRLLDITQGKETTGANSVALRRQHSRISDEFIIVGGDFSNDKDTTRNCVLTRNGGESWLHPVTRPNGYRSSVEYIGKNRLITCGTSGVDVSSDGGMNWTAVSKESFNVCRKAKKGKAVFLAGGNGRIAKLIW